MKKIILPLALVLLFVAGFTACSKPETLKLTVLTYDETSGGEIRQTYENMKEVIPAFKEIMKKKGKDVTVDFQLIPPDDDSARVKIAADLAANKAADIMILNPPVIAEFVEADYLYDITEKVEGWADWAQFYKSAKEAVSYKGRVYGFPIGIYSSAISYRKDLFKEAGLPEKWQPESYQDIIDAAETLKKHFPDMEMPISIPIGSQWGIEATFEVILPLIWANNGQMFNQETDKWVAESSALNKTIDVMYEIVVEKKLTSIDIHKNPDPWSATVKMFSEGDNAIFLGTSGLESWAFGADADYPLPDLYNQFGYAAFPGDKTSEDNKFTGFCDSYIHVVNKKTKDIDMVMEFLKLFNTAEYAGKVSTIGNGLPTREDAVQYVDSTSNPYLTEFSWVLNYTKIYPMDENFPSVDLLYQNIGDQILNGETKENVLKNFKADLTKLLGEKLIEIQN